MKGTMKANARMKEQVLQNKRCFSNKNMRNTGMNIKVKLSATNHSFYKA